MSTVTLPLFACVERSRTEAHHQRVPVPGKSAEAVKELRRNEAKAKAQEDAVLAFFRANPGSWAPSEVWQRVGPKGDLVRLYRDLAGLPSRMGFAPQAGAPLWPITSIRRAVTNLSDEERYPNGKPPLRMTLERIRGPWGRPEHKWTLNEEKQRND